MEVNVGKLKYFKIERVFRSYVYLDREEKEKFEELDYI